MRAVLIDPDPAWLDERRRRGADRFDEVWDGVLHVVPFPTTEHNRRESALEAILRPIAATLGLEVFHHGMGLFDPDAGETNSRSPDLTIVHPSDVSKRGVEGHAELVIEILSPNDESREKLPFYARCQISEVWLLHPITREVEVYVLRGAAYFAVVPNQTGSVTAPRLGLELRVVDGPKLRISWADGSAEI